MTEQARHPRDIAKEVLTERQFEAWDCSERGMGYWQVADALKCSKSNARDLVKAAYRKLERHTEAA